MYWGYHYWGMHLFWWFFWVAIVMLLVSTGWPRSRVTVRDAAIDALRTRYAAGEIDEEEYRERLAVLTGPGHGATGAPGDRAGRSDAQPPHISDERTRGGADGRDLRI